MQEAQPGDVVASGPWKGFEVVSTYGDRQALEDGVLVDVSALVPGGKGNRATQAIWSEFTSEKLPGLTDVTRLVALWTRALAAPIEDEWHVLRDDELGSVWLIPNEVGGRTLMRPEDY